MSRKGKLQPGGSSHGDSLGTSSSHPISSKSSFGGDDWSDPDSQPSGEIINPPKYVSQPSAASEEQPGVQIPALLQNLFGLDFLPIHVPLAEPIQEEEDDSALDLSSRSLDQDALNSTAEMALCESPPNAGPTDGAEETPITARKMREFRGQRIKSAYGMIKTKVKDAKERRQSRRRRDTDDEGEIPFNGSNSRCSTHEDLLHHESFYNQSNLDSHKKELSAVLVETLEAQSRAEQIAKRVKSSQLKIENLEQILSRSINQLQDDAKALYEINKELDSLQKRRDVVEHELHSATRGSSPQNGNHSVASPKRRSSDITPLTPKTCNHSANGSKTAPQQRRHTELHHDVRPRRFTEDFLMASSSPLARKTIMPLSRSEGNFAARRLCSPEVKKELRQVSSFMRIHDLDIMSSAEVGVDSASDSSFFSQNGVLPVAPTLSSARDAFISIDQNVGFVLEALIRFGYGVVTDESDRFVPVQNTEKTLSKTAGREPNEYWPIRTWHIVEEKDIVVWQGSVSHRGPGHDLPLIKARGIIAATPELVIDLLMDSSRVNEYNKMSQGRSDRIYLQKGIHTKAADSDYGIAGEAKITQSLNRPPVIRKNIEMVNLTYARPLDECSMLGCKSYIAASRSVWEDDSGVVKSSKDTVRSEMHLGVSLLRPVLGQDGTCYCELTTITHVHASAVPDILAKRMAPSHAVGFIKEIQTVFAK